jgi:hypothetical protein
MTATQKSTKFLKTFCSFAGRATLLGVLAMGLSVTGCDDEDDDGSKSDAAVDGGGNDARSDAGTKSDASVDSGTVGDAGGDASGDATTNG